ncbi:MAG: gliding motility-associated C-terminal domain-containing protein, partial [Flavobacteriales bacterium]
DSDGDGLPDSVELLGDCDDDNLPNFIDPFDFCDEEEVPSDRIIPEGFSPNDDGVGDEWVLQGFDGFPMSSVRIYNRWGNIVYSADDWDYAWDGYSAGPYLVDTELLPMGTYFYFIEFEKGAFPIRGFVFLKR